VEDASKDLNGLYDPVLPLFQNEYQSLLHALSNGKEWSILDCVRQSKQGGGGNFSPVTFADGYIDSKTGEEKCCDPALYNAEDALSKQSLDYIIMLEMA